VLAGVDADGLAEADGPDGLTEADADGLTEAVGPDGVPGADDPDGPDGLTGADDWAAVAPGDVTDAVAAELCERPALALAPGVLPGCVLADVPDGDAPGVIPRIPVDCPGELAPLPVRAVEVTPLLTVTGTPGPPA
jgi:hypothetical protein